MRWYRASRPETLHRIDTCFRGKLLTDRNNLFPHNFLELLRCNGNTSIDYQVGLRSMAIRCKRQFRIGKVANSVRYSVVPVPHADRFQVGNLTLLSD